MYLCKSFFVAQETQEIIRQTEKRLCEIELRKRQKKRNQVHPFIEM